MPKRPNDTTTRSNTRKARRPTGGTAAWCTALALLAAVGATAQAHDGMWDVTCGLPVPDSPFAELLPTGGYNGPWGGPTDDGHLEVKTLNRAHPEGSLSTEMWVLSHGVGWWKLKAIRVHSEDISKITLDETDNAMRGIRQIIDSPFLEQPAVIRSNVPNAEEVVNGQILALMPVASRLRCATENEKAR